MKCKYKFTKIKGKCVKRSKEVIEAINQRKNMGGLRTADYNQKKDLFTYQIERGKTGGAIVKGDKVIIPYWHNGKEHYREVKI